LNETSPILTTDHLYLDAGSNPGKPWRAQSQFELNPIQFLFGVPTTLASWNSKFISQWSGVNVQLPNNVYLQTLMPVHYPVGNPAQYILRLHHLYAINEDPIYSRPVTVNLSGLFKNKELSTIEETNLTAVQKRSDMHRLHWNTETKQSSAFPQNQPLSVDQFEIVLNPMQTRTFLVTFKDV